MRFLQTAMIRLGIMGELLRFFWHSKWWWMTPMLVLLLAFGLLVTLAQIPAVAPFIYTLF